MPFELPSRLWMPQRRGFELTVDALARGKSVCMYGPTGSGKSIVAATLFQWALSSGMRGSFYLNRKLLIGQMAKRFDEAGIRYGIRAADYEDYYDFGAPIQICSADTERARVFESKQWGLHDADLVVVDEAHLQKTQVIRKIFDYYKERGAMIVGLTATPIGLSDWYDELVLSGTLKEYRECKAIVPAIVRSIEQPDMRKVKRNVTGEFVMDGKKRKIYTQTIVSSVIDRWKKYNPDARPTMLYAPGKDESVWFTEQFRKIGVSWAHVDATDAIVDGIRVKLTRPLWDEIQERFKAGDIKGISNRYKCREGLDITSTYHCILATPIGSLASYIQTVGRVLRYSEETPDHVLVTDHGGAYHRLGSPNADRPWHDWWTLSEGAVSEMNVSNIKDGKAPEPIRCPKCEGERTGGLKCPHCGFEHQKSKRHVIMEDGRMVEFEGDMIPPRRVKKYSDTEEKWAKMFWGFKNKKVDRTFNQLAAFFEREYGYQPPRDGSVPFMPIGGADWHRKVHAVEMGLLHSKK